MLRIFSMYGTYEMEECNILVIDLELVIYAIKTIRGVFIFI